MTLHVCHESLLRDLARVPRVLPEYRLSAQVEDMLRVIELTKQMMVVGEQYSDTDSRVLRG